MQDKLKGQYLISNQPINKVVHIYRRFYQPRLCAIQYVQPLEDWDYRVHSHSVYELIIPQKNPYKCSLNSHSLEVPVGSFILIQTGQIHQDFFSKEAPFRGIQFYIDCTEEQDTLHTLFPPDFPLQKQIAPLPAMALKICDLLFEAVSAKLSDTVNNSIFSGLFWLLTESFQPNLLLNTDASSGENVLHYRINRLFQTFLQDGNFSMRRLQSELNVSRRTLDHVCYRIFSEPPARAFQVFRCKMVQQFLMEHPETSLKTTAELFHFHDQFAMSRTFKNIFGYSPFYAKYPKNEDDGTK